MKCIRFEDRLSETFCYAAVNLDNYIRRKTNAFDNVDGLAEVIKSHAYGSSKDFALCMAVRNGSQKNIRLISELQLEIGLLYLELKHSRYASKERLEELRDFCIDASNNLREEEAKYPIAHYLVA